MAKTNSRKPKAKYAPKPDGSQHKPKKQEPSNWILFEKANDTETHFLILGKGILVKVSSPNGIALEYVNDIKLIQRNGENVPMNR